MIHFSANLLNHTTYHKDFLQVKKQCLNINNKQCISVLRKNNAHRYCRVLLNTIVCVTEIQIYKLIISMTKTILTIAVIDICIKNIIFWDHVSTSWGVPELFLAPIRSTPISNGNTYLSTSELRSALEWVVPII